MRSVAVPTHKVYVAGPMTGLPEYNRPAFFAEAQALQLAGCAVLNPATLPDGMEQHEYMQICVAMVQVADELVMLPGWERSSGAVAEHALAVKLGKRITMRQGVACGAS